MPCGKGAGERAWKLAAGLAAPDTHRMNAGLDPSVRLKPRKLTRRGVDARDRIITAMVACIVRSGFAATTVEHVMAEAGLSRGSVLHQFPTRLELTVACADHAMRGMMDVSAARAAEIADPFDRLADYADVMWAANVCDYGIVVTEILLATRWDGELAQALQPVTQEIETRIHAEYIKLATEAGLPDPQAYVPHGWMLLGSVRGLVIEYTLNPARPMILEAIAVMKDEYRGVCERLRAKNSQA